MSTPENFRAVLDDFARLASGIAIMRASMATDPVGCSSLATILEQWAFEVLEQHYCDTPLPTESPECDHGAR